MRFHKKQQFLSSFHKTTLSCSLKIIISLPKKRRLNFPLYRSPNFYYRNLAFCYIRFEPSREERKWIEKEASATAFENRPAPLLALFEVLPSAYFSRQGRGIFISSIFIFGRLSLFPNFWSILFYWLFFFSSSK